jgi:predicted alpha/beta hydrolase family esterase
LGSAGHINVDSGHGPWPKGRALLHGLVQQVQTESFSI